MFGLVAAFALLLALPAPAHARNFAATVLNDGGDYDLTDGVCDADPITPNIPDPRPGHEGEIIGQCTLRAAIQNANLTPEADTIELRGSIYALGVTGAGEDAAVTGDLDITTEVEILGRGYQQTFIEAKKLKDRIFDVKPGGKLTLTGVALKDGKTAKGDFDPGAPGQISGGCIRSAGSLTLREVFFVGCSSGGNGGSLSVIGDSADVATVIINGTKAKAEGGGIWVGPLGSLTLANSAAGLASAGTGGAIAARGALDVRYVTLVANKSKTGGAVAVLGGAAGTIAQSTISSNGSVNVDASGGTLALTNTIVWGAKKNDCVGGVSSNGGNLEGGTSCGFTSTNDQQSQNPLLQPLAFNGGAIPTSALGTGSPAIDHGVDGGDACTSVDERGLLRVDVKDVGVALADVGAYEAGGVPPQPKLATPITTATVGQLYQYDADGDSGREACRTYSLTAAPSGMTIDASGMISWTPSAGQVGPTGNQVLVRVDDAAGASNSQTFTVTVAPAL